MSTLGMFISRAIVSAPSQLLDRLHQRCSACTALEAAENPVFCRYEHQFQAAVVTFRRPQPWTLVVEGQKAASLFREVGEQIMAQFIEADTLALGWLELGDHAGVQSRLLALETKLLQLQSLPAITLWRRSLGRTLTQMPEESAWAQAEQVMQPVLANAGAMALFAVFAHEILARVALNRRQMDEALAHAREVMPLLPVCPALVLATAAVQIHALIAPDRVGEATTVAEQLLATISGLGGAGIFEVEVRVAASEAFHTAGKHERARAELRETLRQIQLRADDIKEPFWKNSYLTRNPYCIRAHALAQQWGSPMAG